MNRRGASLAINVVIMFVIGILVLIGLMALYGNTFAAVEEQLNDCSPPEHQCAYFWDKPPAEAGSRWVMAKPFILKPMEGCKRGQSCFAKQPLSGGGGGRGGGGTQPPDVDAQILDKVTGNPVPEDFEIIAGTTYIWKLKSAHRLAGRCEAEIRNNEGQRIPFNGVLTKEIANCGDPDCHEGEGGSSDCFFFRIPSEKATEVPFAFHFTVYDVTAPTREVKSVTRILHVFPDPDYTGPPLGDTTPPPRPATIQAYHWIAPSGGTDRWGVAFSPVDAADLDFYTVYWVATSGEKRDNVRPGQLLSHTPTRTSPSCRYPTSLTNAMAYSDVAALSLRTGTRITRAGCPEAIYFVTDEASSSFMVTTTDRRGNNFPRDNPAFWEPVLHVTSD